MGEFRKIPVTMFSQHPDHAAAPYWLGDANIGTHHEIDECYRMFRELGAGEMMWDWEGKLVDEAVMEKLLMNYNGFFQERPLGKELFLTFRVPNPSVESGYRLARAFMVMLSAQEMASHIGLPHAPLFEVILPMTEDAGEMMNLQRSFESISVSLRESFGARGVNQKLEVIPLFEQVGTLVRSADILREYVSLYKKEYGDAPKYLRPFCARSDPALNSGIVPTTLAIKWALSEYEKFSQETGIETYPVIAPGALPFRGGLNPLAPEHFIKEFPGVRTFVVQSAFRYDYPFEQVRQAVESIGRLAPVQKTQVLSKATLHEIKEIVLMFERPYQKIVERLAPLISLVAPHVPKRRERVQHIGLFGYSRGVGDGQVRLPRAIGFTASCYSLGIPPELLGVGAGIRQARKAGKLSVVESLYRSFRQALSEAGKYFRKESLDELGLRDLAEEIAIVEEYLGETLGPKTTEEHQHKEVVARIIASIKDGSNFSSDIEKAALLRRSLG